MMKSLDELCQIVIYQQRNVYSSRLINDGYRFLEMAVDDNVFPIYTGVADWADFSKAVENLKEGS